MEDDLFLEERKHDEKTAFISNSAVYTSMDIWREQDGTHGSFTLDDKLGGWYWHGDDDEFLLGLLRVGNSKIYDEFKEDLEESKITKNDMAEAIKTSLNKRPSDGIWHIIGDNRNYKGFDRYDEFYDEEYSIKQCLTHDQKVSKKKAEEVASRITDEASWKMKSTEDIFEELEESISNDVGRLAIGSHNKSWKEFVMDVVDGCKTAEDTATGFMDCVTDELLELKEEGEEAYEEDYRDAIYEALAEVISDKKVLKDIAKDTGVPFSKVEACANGGGW